MKPTPKKPRIIISQVEGSGTALTARRFFICRYQPFGRCHESDSHLFLFAHFVWSAEKISGSVMRRVSAAVVALAAAVAIKRWSKASAICNRPQIVCLQPIIKWIALRIIT
jgi:hypothetical protein